MDLNNILFNRDHLKVVSVIESCKYGCQAEVCYALIDNFKKKYEEHPDVMYVYRKMFLMVFDLEYSETYMYEGFQD